MRAFLDTSVLVAGIREGHGHHPASRTLLTVCDPRLTYCAAHSLAELYSSLTGPRPPWRVHPSGALASVATFAELYQFVSLTSQEVLETLDRTARLGLLGGIVYDALLMACARKIDAERIYTWNVADFRLVAPDLAGRIRTP